MKFLGRNEVHIREITDRSKWLLLQAVTTWLCLVGLPNRELFTCQVNLLTTSCHLLYTNTAAPSRTNKLTIFIVCSDFQWKLGVWDLKICMEKECCPEQLYTEIDI